MSGEKYCGDTLRVDGDGVKLCDFVFPAQGLLGLQEVAGPHHQQMLFFQLLPLQQGRDRPD